MWLKRKGNLLLGARERVTGRSRNAGGTLAPCCICWEPRRCGVSLCDRRPVARRNRMSKLNFALALGPIAALVFAQQIPQDPSAPTFRSQSDLVIVPFRVTRGNLYVQDLKAGDVLLLEDGHPRDFSIFEGPDTQSRTPIELVLLFDTTVFPTGWITPTQYARGGLYGSPKDDFAIGWEHAVSGAVLAGGGSDVRISVYRVDLMQLERLCRPTRDPKELMSAVQALRTPMPYYTNRMTASQRQELRIEIETGGGMGWKGHRLSDFIDQPVSTWPGYEGTRDSGGEYIPLELPPNRKNRDAAGPPGTGNREWPLEAAIGALKNSAASPERVVRMMIIFSQGISGTTTAPEDVAQLAVSLGVPIYPVLKHSKIMPEFWRRLGATEGFEERLGRLGKLTGGRSMVPSPEKADGALVASTLSDILQSVRNEGLSQYVVGFAPHASSDTPREHKLEIKLGSRSGRQLTGGKRQAIY
jgi:hypothetical protein